MSRAYGMVPGDPPSPMSRRREVQVVVDLSTAIMENNDQRARNVWLPSLRHCCDVGDSVTVETMCHW
jgi:hypothetical protein